MDSDPVCRLGPERGATGGEGRPRSFPSGPLVSRERVPNRCGGLRRDADGHADRLEPKTKTGARHGQDSGRHQRFRAHRTQLLPRAPRAGRRLRDRRGERSRRREDDGAPAQVRLGPGPAGRGRRGRGRVHPRRRLRDQDARRARSGGAALGRARRGRRARVHRVLHQARGRAEAHRRGREEGRDLRTGDGARRHSRARRQRRRLRPVRAPRDLQRLLHHQLPRAVGQGDRRRVRRRAGLHDHDPRVHARPEVLRPAAQGPAARPGSGDQPDPDVDRRREGDRPRAAEPEGEARRDRRPRARPDRLDHRPRRPARRRRRPATR